MLLRLPPESPPRTRRSALAFLSEAEIESAFLDHLRVLGYSIEREDDIGSDGHRPERESHDEAFLKERML